MSNKLTVLVPSLNEERNLRPCLESVRDIADEVIVADNGSTDRTLDIARELGARVIEREWITEPDFRNWAITHASHEWVLFLDCDERVSPALATGIRQTLVAPTCEAYVMRRQNFLFGHPIRHGGWRSDRVTRLFRRDTCRYDDRRVHSAIMVPSGQIGTIPGALLHYTYWTMDDYLEKFVRYTSWSADDLRDTGRRAGPWQLLVRPAWRFFREYIIQQGFRDGVPGILVSGTSAMNVFTKYARLWSMQNGQPQPNPETTREQEGPRGVPALTPSSAATERGATSPTPRGLDEEEPAG